MDSFLTEMLAEKRREVDALKNRGLQKLKKQDDIVSRDFRHAISREDRINLITEIKFASPSAGTIYENGDALDIGQAYERAGAAAISLLTDKKYFKGDLEFLPRLKKAVSLPILRKDFILDEIQVMESFLSGADAILLIARILSRRALGRMLNTCRSLGMDALTEVHDQKDLDKAMDCGADIIGINNRDLETFEVSLETTLGLAPKVPKGTIIVSESGIKNARDIRTLRSKGIHAALVGTSIMKSGDPEKMIRRLQSAGKREDGQD